jgi:hypothetical protein
MISPYAPNLIGDFNFDESPLRHILTYKHYINTIEVLRTLKLKQALILRVHVAQPLGNTFATPFPIIEAIEGDEKDLFLLNLYGRDALLNTMELHHVWERLRPWRRVASTTDMSSTSVRWMHAVNTASKHGLLTLRA